MAFVRPTTNVSTGDVLTASRYNADVVGNMQAMGLIHVTSQSFTSATSVTLDNVFTTSYRAYRIHLAFTAPTGIGWVSGVMRSSAPADVSTSNYDQTVVQTTAVADKTRVTANAQTSWANLFLIADRGAFATLDIMNPAQTEYTQGVLSAFASDNADTSKAISVMGGFGFRATTAHAGIKFSFGSATGFARVYAYGEG